MINFTQTMFIVAVVAIVTAGKLLYTALKVKDAATARQRYGAIAVCQVILAACAVWLLCMGSAGEIFAGVQHWYTLQDDSIGVSGMIAYGTALLGSLVTLGVVLVFASPFITAYAVFEIRSYAAGSTKSSASRNISAQS